MIVCCITIYVSAPRFYRLLLLDHVEILTPSFRGINQQARDSVSGCDVLRASIQRTLQWPEDQQRTCAGINRATVLSLVI
jgi:hypothetical protein